MSTHPEAVRLRIEYECRPFLGSWDYAPPDAPMSGDGEEYGPVYLALPAPTFDALLAERDALRSEVAEVKATHARILAWPPQDVVRADSVIAQAAATLARIGCDGKAVLDALDTIKRHRSQQSAQIDAAQAEVARLRGLLEEARTHTHGCLSEYGWGDDEGHRGCMDDDDARARDAWLALIDASMRHAGGKE